VALAHHHAGVTLAADGHAGVTPGRKIGGAANLQRFVSGKWRLRPIGIRSLQSASGPKMMGESRLSG
jgi:hypothetical protein